MSDQTAPAHPRRIRSFVTRAGRVSNAQGRALETLLPIYGVPYQEQQLDAVSVFGRVAPLVLEIGFGMGETTAALAEQRPDVNFLALEVHTPGVGALLKLIDAAKLQNLRIMQHDAIEVLEHMIAPGQLAGIHIYFPDPWPKARHHKRRLIQGPLVAELARRLAPGAYIHLATDWQHYAEQMLEVLRAEPRLAPTCENYSQRTNPLVARPETKFEARGLRLGHGVWDLVFVRRSEDS